MWRNPFTPALVLCLLGLAGCRSGWELGRDHYRDARYPDALNEFSDAEADYAALSREDQAHYALYRGLSYLAVGDAVRADAWLSVAKRELDTRPDTFTPDERGQLIAAWQSMGRMAGVGAYGQPWFAGAPSER
ncbi:MAG: hypothetical protein H6718_00710 [Polyangiaceae bacterium]|nr:hypothetical protein [Polyangiaceae bacterium]MCB9607860.1 hypothetical protein [Polyangiaceae bacterium]